MCKLQVLIDPFNKVILEDSLDELVKDVRCKKFMYIRMWKAMHVRLKVTHLSDTHKIANLTYHNIITKPIFIP